MGFGHARGPGVAPFCAADLTTITQHRHAAAAVREISADMVDNLVTSLAAAGAPERMICRTSRAEMEVDTVTSKSST